MIKWLIKYGTVIFLFNTVLLSIEYTFNIGNQIFLSLMVIFLFVLLINPKQIKTILFHKAFLFLLILNLINLLYFLLFPFSFSQLQTQWRVACAVSVRVKELDKC